MLETAYDTFCAGETEAIVTPNGDRIYTKRPEMYLRDMAGLVNVSDELVLK